MEYTTLTHKEIDRICQHFSIGEVTAFKVLSGGSENTNYLLTTSTGQYVLSICEQKSIAEATYLAYLLEYLQKHHFSTSRIIRDKDNHPITVWEGKPIMIKSFIEGTVERDLSPYLIQCIGRELGKLHQLEAPEYLPKQLNFGREKFNLVKEYAKDSSFDHWLQDIQAYISPYLDMDLPRSLVHSDVFWNNVIISKDRNAVVIMDFEEAACYYRVFDIGMTIIGICSEVDVVHLEKAALLLKGYQEIISLTEAEKKSLKPFAVYAGASMTFWRHMNFNYVHPLPTMADHYLGLKVLTDFIIDLDDQVFAEMVRSYS